MSGWQPCTCEGTPEEKRKNWVVLHRKHNHSYFESPKGCEHYSDYSLVCCLNCSGMFRTKADYVSDLPDGEYNTKTGKVERLK
jgi:hypothetical protein